MIPFVKRKTGITFVTLMGLTVSSWAEFTIFRPSFGVPEFALTNGAFRVEVRADPGLASNGWSAVLANDLRSWTGAVEQVDYGQLVENHSTTGYCLTVRVPADTPPELFRLTLSHPSGGSTTNRHAVSVLRSFESDFYILHYADPQAQVSNSTTASGLYGSHGCIEEIYWHARVFNLINPRFLFDTGDELDDKYVTWAHSQEYLDAMNTLSVPVLVTRGNNDIVSGGSDWDSQIGVPTFSITIGSFYICMKDYIANDHYSWFTNDYAASFRNTNVAFRLLGQHYLSGGYTYSPPSGQYPDLMLVGHDHDNGTLQTSPYYVLKTEHGCNYGGVGMFEFFKSGTNWLCPGRTNHPGGTFFYTVGDWGAPKITNWYANANDGTQVTNTAFITNSLPRNFWDGRVRYLLQRVRGGYAVSGGEKLAEYDYGASNSAVLVKVNIASNALTRVSVLRADSDEDGMADDWELATFTNLTTATAGSDYDGDSFLDRDEYVAGTCATNSESLLRLTDLGAQPGFVFRWPSATSRIYTIYWSSNLLSDFEPFVTNINPTPPWNTYTDMWHAASTTSFYRVWLRKL